MKNGGSGRVVFQSLNTYIRIEKLESKNPWITYTIKWDEKSFHKQHTPKLSQPWTLCLRKKEEAVGQAREQGNPKMAPGNRWYAGRLNLYRYNHLYTNVHNGCVCNNQKVESAQMSRDRWLNYLWCTHTKKYSAIKRNELLIHPSTSMNFQRIKLREKNKGSPKRLYTIWFHAHSTPEMTSQRDREQIIRSQELGKMRRKEVTMTVKGKHRDPCDQTLLYLDCSVSRMNLHMW